MAKPTTRRNFLRGSSAATLAALASAQASFDAPLNRGAPDSGRAADSDAPRDETKTLGHGPHASAALSDIDLSPAKWIWFPSARTLPNTFVLFRRELKLEEKPKRSNCWITADSRYRLTVNGEYLQRGIAPCDPRWMDVDPVDISDHLREGANVIGIEVVYFGTGESMWVAGYPGLLFSLELEFESGRKERLVSDETWQCRLDRAHRPGQYKRWLLRALQEDFDARLHPYGWDRPEYAQDPDWIQAAVTGNQADKPSLCTQFEDSLWLRIPNDATGLWLRRRSIPLLTETLVPAQRLQESARVRWLRAPEDWFEFRMPNSFLVERQPVATPQRDGEWSFPACPDASAGLLATFEFPEEILGYPYFQIDAPAGTVIELSCQESHDPAQTAWLDTHWFKWARFTCREGANRFETCDTEALRWLQLHVHNASRPVIIRNVGARRRVFPWPNEPRIRCSEAPLQRLFDASINTLCNSAQETSNDPGRERQQYGGCGSLQLQGVRYAFGEFRMPQRVLRTYSEGSSPEGYFLDPWPACEVLSYLGQRQIGLTVWGSDIDEGVTFTLNCWNHYMESGDLESMREIYPRLIRLSRFLEGAIGQDGLLPVEGVGEEALDVWLDDDAFPWNQPARLRQCAFNLHTAAVIKGALAPMALAFGEPQESDRLARFAAGLEAATVRRFWSHERRLFVDNLPWIKEDKTRRLSDRALATSILYNQCPGGDTAAAKRALIDMPKEVAVSYPMNAIWRYWALARVGRADIVVKELRSRWATMPSVIENNSLPEIWNHKPDGRDEWNYFQVTPLNVLFTDVVGIRPLAPGFARCQIRPQLADLGNLELTAHTGRGPIEFAAKATPEGHQVTLNLPKDCEGELLLLHDIPCDLPAIAPDHPLGLKRYRLTSGTANVFRA